MPYLDEYDDRYGRYADPEIAAVPTVIDYAASKPNPTLAAQAGVRAACRYLRDLDKTNGDKSLTLTEVRALNAVGIKVVCNEETTGVQYARGYTGGVADAQLALAAAKAVGMPDGRPIYFTPLDHDPAGLDDNGWSLLRNYAKGVHDELGDLAGFYGGVRMLDDLKSRGYGRWWWQALGWRVDANGRKIDTREEAIAKGYHLRQYQNGVTIWGGEVDYDEPLVADFGQWALGQEDDVTVEELLDALESDRGVAAIRRGALLGSQDTLRTAVAGAKDRAAGPYFSGLATDVKSIKDGVGTLSDDEANLLTAYNTGQATLLQAINGLVLGDPTAVQRLFDAIDALGPEISQQVNDEFARRQAS